MEEKCGGNWEAINDEMTQTAVDFLQKPTKFLSNLERKTGYDSCHRTQEYDVDQCHQDCEKLENSNFANKCREGGGLYKCCIR